jgi:alcohol oxidase
MTSMADVNTLIWGYKFTREIARRMPSFRGEVKSLHPSFPMGSAAGILEKSEGPISFDSPRIAYTPEDDAAVEKYTREFGIGLIPLYYLTIGKLTRVNLY